MGATAAGSGAGPSILLLSGWNLYNIGDVAITPGFLRLVRRFVPEARVTVLAASYPEELRAYLQKFPEQLGEIELLPMEFKAGEPLSPAMEAAFAGADLLVLNSGMTLSYGYYGHAWERILPRLLAFLKARELGVPYGIYGHSFDRIDPPADILYRDVLGRAAFVYTRDSESLALLRAKGVACPEMAFGPDSTFAFDLRNGATEGYADRFLSEHGLEAGRFLAFVPRLDVDRFRDDGRELVHAEQTREMIAQWVRRTGEPVVIVPEVSRLLEAHKPLVFDRLPADVAPLVRYMADYWMPDEAQAVYARARLVVSAEMHSVILALAAGTPALHPHFAQAGLKQWMLRDLGIEEWLFDQDAVPVERIADAMVAVQEAPETARRAVARATEAFRRRQGETMAVLRAAALGHRDRAAHPAQAAGPLVAPAAHGGSA
ncbi:MAG TPA: polysaccharide pyruvyl transferase family protein [Chloroflexota bacterium]|nr:polysaccharide pyruvyl transferase family protein [Chloroflexota bacterium]